MSNENQKLMYDGKSKKFYLENNKDEAYSLVEFLEMFRQTNAQIFQSIMNVHERVEKLEAAAANKSKIIA